MNNHKVAVLGAGAWGTSLSIALNRAGSNVFLLPKFISERDALIKNKKSAALDLQIPNEIEFGPSFETLKEGTQAFDDMFTTLSSVEAVFWAVPVANTLETAHILKPIIIPSVPVVICSKGFVWDEEDQCGVLLSDAIQRVLPNPTGVLSGPNFAREVAVGMHSASVLSSFDITLCKTVAPMIVSPTFKIYASRDTVGVQVSGALKNVLAIACGMVSGLGLGQNTKAIIFEQGFAEIVAFVQKCGGVVGTLLGVSGIGDVAMTCFSEQSRNTTFGARVARKESVGKLLKEMRVEGADTARAAYAMARRFDLQTPVLDMVYNVVYCEAAPEPSVLSVLNDSFV
ncbi:MAG: NAD(P)H-dependent glycerol-3-phosphate dehydrogenase [Holosporales bacterium]|jgi:glycerol-3-phosphate dehydrogenase (NAD(P)+)|nr:NAD(P)H-dependent glycerol-3-phosphate dehydrogenase [Holosporales bacterium]